MAEGDYDDVNCVELSEMDRGEREEMLVDIYLSPDAVRVQDTSTQRETPTQQTDVRTGSRSSRRAVVGVGLLSVLLLTTNIVLYMCYVERETLLSSIRNLTEERDQLKNSYQNEEKNILQTTYDHLVKLTDAVRGQDTSTQTETTTQQTDVRTGSRCSRWAVVGLGLLCVLLLTTNIVLYKYYIRDQTISTAERETLLSSTRNLTEEKKMLQTRYDHLVKLTENDCFTDWKKNRSSFYFFSTEKKNWNNSRQHCRERGADLVIINSREEQMFLVDQNKEKRSFWMGLTDIHTEDTWKWVDDQPLTEQLRFWRKDEPNNGGNGEDCAVFSNTVEDGQRTWNDLSCSDTENWICEFNLTHVHLNTST